MLNSHLSQVGFRHDVTAGRCYSRRLYSQSTLLLVAVETHYQSPFPLRWVNVEGIQLSVPEDGDGPGNKCIDIVH